MGRVLVAVVANRQIGKDPGNPGSIASDLKISSEIPKAIGTPKEEEDLSHLELWHLHQLYILKTLS